MAMNFDNPEAVSVTIDSAEIAAFGVDLGRSELYITVKENASDGTVGRERTIVRDPLRLQAAIARASQIAGVDIYGPLKQALYEEYAAESGKTGTVV